MNFYEGVICRESRAIFAGIRLLGYNRFGISGYLPNESSG
jgi:hypothetical protein